MTLDEVVELARREQFLAVVATVQRRLQRPVVARQRGRAGPSDQRPTSRRVRHVRRGEVAQPPGQAARRGHVPLRMVMGDGRGPRRADRPG